MSELDIDKIKEYIRQSSKDSAVYIGCDSARHKKKGEWFASYSRVVVIHHDSSRGCKIFGDIELKRDFGVLSLRLMNEVYMATDLALELADVIDDRPFEIHLDINRSKDHKSSVVVKEACGYVRGMLGVEPKLKPYALASSAAADNFGRIQNTIT